ncbi:unnamed protein product, partial [Strongylus vulgaris]
QGDESVIECSALQGEPLSLKLSYNINGTTDSSTKGEPTNWRLSGNQGTEFFLNSTASFIDGIVYCSALLNITGAISDGLLKFSPFELYYLLMANGPTDANGVNISMIVPGFDTDPCGLSKGCFLATNTNTDPTPNGVAVSYRVMNNSFIFFELVAPSSSKTGSFVAVSFSSNGILFNTPSIECSSLGTDALSMKFSYYDATGTNVRIPGEESIRQTYITQETAVFQDGQIYCSALVNSQGSSVSDEATFDASTCNVDKSCVLPDQCYRGCNGMGVSYEILANSIMKIELFSVLNANNQYIAVGFSDDDKMGNDYVIECSALPNQRYSLKFSYNDNSPANVRIPSEETISSSYFTQSNIIAFDGELYCSALVNVSGWSQSKEVFTYNPSQAYYLLLASGFTNDQGLDIHKHTFVSTPRFLNGDDISSNNFDYATCGTKKGCFISNKANAMAASYQVR